MSAPDKAAGAADFWPSSGYHFLDRDEHGRLGLTDDFLRLYFSRPEVAPVPDSCAHERQLHKDLLENPRLPVTPARLMAIRDRDARDNYQVLLSFRDHLARHRTIEEAYIGLFQEERIAHPPLFLDQLVAVILRGLLDDAAQPFRARAAELFFRPQRVSIDDGQILLADQETVEMLAAGGGFGSLGRLVAENNTPLRAVDIDILGEDNREQYWARSDRHDMALDLGFGRPGLDAFCRVMESWIGHLMAVSVGIQPVQTIRDERWVWHIGLDIEASAIMNALYEGGEVEEQRMARVLSLFRMEFREPQQMLARVRGRPVYLAIAMDEAGNLRMKPQNLLVNLPLAARS